MADLTRFVNLSLRPDDKIKIYLGRGLPIGDGGMVALSQLYARIRGSMGGPYPVADEDVEIWMPDLSPSGMCKIKRKADPAPVEYKYWTDGDTLRIQYGALEISLQPGDKAWSWAIILRTVSIGLWPARLAHSGEEAVSGDGEVEAEA